MIKYTKSFLKKLNKKSIIGKFFEENKIIDILRGEVEEHFKVNISQGEAHVLLTQLQKDGIIITKDERTIGVIANCRIEKKFKVYGINIDAIEQKDSLHEQAVLSSVRPAISLENNPENFSEIVVLRKIANEIVNNDNVLTKNALTFLEYWKNTYKK